LTAAAALASLSGRVKNFEPRNKKTGRETNRGLDQVQLTGDLNNGGHIGPLVAKRGEYPWSRKRENIVALRQTRSDPWINLT
jgi:hypothetical protein